MEQKENRIRNCSYVYTSGKYSGEMCVNESLPGETMCNKHHGKHIFICEIANYEKFYDKCTYSHRKNNNILEKCSNRAILGLDLCSQHYETVLHTKVKFYIFK